MTAQIIDGKAIAKSVREEVATGVGELREKTGKVPGLAVVLVGEDPASQTYVRNKGRAADKCGMYSRQESRPASITQEELIALVDELNEAEDVHGILVQLPLPKHLDATAVNDRIRPEKDVDGFHPANVGLLVSGRPCLVPCTPSGVMVMLDRAGLTLKGAEAVVVGRSLIVGKPMAQLLTAAHATVTVCHSRTKDLPAVCRRADILVAATGQAEMVRADWVKPGAAVIDVGISFIERDGKFKQIGDVAYGEVSEVAGWITPNPGGVGPMTIAMLMANTLQAAKSQLGAN